MISGLPYGNIILLIISVVSCMHDFSLAIWSRLHGVILYMLDLQDWGF
jgi:hypothetical protein